MNMGATSTMAMAMSTATSGAAAGATTTAAAMSMSGGSGCKISMLWNWTVIDSCFISKQWRIRTHGMFAGSCIAVVFLVILLEFLRRAGKEFDRFIVRQAQQQAAALRRASEAHDGGASPANSKGACAVAGTDADSGDQKSAFPFPSMKASAGTFRPNLWQQAVRATLHLFQFSVAYFVMLLAMYYNGYLIICIFIGAWIGAFIFSWEAISLGDKKEEVTVCCG